MKTIQFFSILSLLLAVGGCSHDEAPTPTSNPTSLLDAVSSPMGENAGVDGVGDESGTSQEGSNTNQAFGEKEGLPWTLNITPNANLVGVIKVQPLLQSRFWTMIREWAKTPPQTEAGAPSLETYNPYYDSVSPPSELAPQSEAKDPFEDLDEIPDEVKNAIEWAVVTQISELIPDTNERPLFFALQGNFPEDALAKFCKVFSPPPISPGEPDKCASNYLVALSPMLSCYFLNSNVYGLTIESPAAELGCAYKNGDVLVFAHRQMLDLAFPLIASGGGSGNIKENEPLMRALKRLDKNAAVRVVADTTGASEIKREADGPQVPFFSNEMFQQLFEPDYENPVFALSIDVSQGVMIRAAILSEDAAEIIGAVAFESSAATLERVQLPQ